VKGEKGEKETYGPTIEGKDHHAECKSTSYQFKKRGGSKMRSSESHSRLISEHKLVRTPKVYLEGVRTFNYKKVDGRLVLLVAGDGRSADYSKL